MHDQARTGGGTPYHPLGMGNAATSTTTSHQASGPFSPVSHSDPEYWEYLREYTRGSPCFFVPWGKAMKAALRCKEAFPCHPALEGQNCMHWHISAPLCERGGCNLRRAGLHLRWWGSQYQHGSSMPLLKEQPEKPAIL